MPPRFYQFREPDDEQGDFPLDWPACVKTLKPLIHILIGCVENSQNFVYLYIFIERNIITVF